MTIQERINEARNIETDYQNDLINKIISPEFHIWFGILQRAADKVKSGERLHVQTFESACTAMARYLGLAPEIEKEEDDKSSVRMKCVKCDLIKTEDVCSFCNGTEFKVVEDGEHVWLGGIK